MTDRIRTCSRCKGTRYVNSPVAHCGIPGLCYKCDGSGKTYHPTMATRVATYIRRCEATLVDLEKRAEEVKEAARRRRERFNARRAKRGQAPKPFVLGDLDAQKLEQLRDQYRTMRRKLEEVKAAGKVKAADQPATLPSRFAPA